MIHRFGVFKCEKKPGQTKAAILKELFGCAGIKNCSFDRIKLEWHPGNTLSEKKVNSIGKKYFTIPEELIDYYPILRLLDDLEKRSSSYRVFFR